LIRVQFAMVGISLVMNITLIPVFGVIGAALAGTVVNVAGNIWNLAEVRKALRIFPYNRSYFVLVIPVTLSAASVIFLRFWMSATVRAWIGILIAVALAYVVFTTIAVMFALDDDDKMIAASAWAQIRASLQMR